MLKPSRLSLLMLTASTLAAVTLTTGCAAPSRSSDTTGTAPRDTMALALLNPASGSRVNGIVRLNQVGAQVELKVRVSGLMPNREYGFHVHEKGDCSAPDASSAGAHLHPSGKAHGGAQHPGDLPALRSDAAGVAETRMSVTGSLLGGGAGDLMGKALVVHASVDGHKSPAAESSGLRIACGVIATPVRPGGIGGNSEAKTIPKQM